MFYVSSYVFSTKERRPMTKPNLQDRLWPFMGGRTSKKYDSGIDCQSSLSGLEVLWISVPSLERLGYCQRSLRDMIRVIRGLLQLKGGLT